MATGVDGEGAAGAQGHGRGRRSMSTRRPRINKPQSLREVLDVIDEFLASHNDADKLWAVLTALRGPDNADYDLKHSTTVHVRRAAFPETSQTHQLAYFVPMHDLISKRELERSPINTHFIEHISNAIHALGLWEEAKSHDTD